MWGLPVEFLLICSILVGGILAFQLVAALHRLREGEAVAVELQSRLDRASCRLNAEAAARQAAETARRSSEGRTRAILEAAVDGIITIDERGRIQGFNQAAEKIFQYRAAEVLGCNVNMLMPDPYHSAHDLYLSNYLTTGQPHIIGIGREVAGRRKDGTVFPLDLTVGESELDGRRVFAGIIRDISERKKTEELLYQMEENFRVLVNGVSDYAIILLDTAGNISSWNRGARLMHGWSPEEVLGRHYSALFRPQDARAGEPDRLLSIVRREGQVDAEGVRQRKDGSTYRAYDTMTPLKDDRGNLRGYLSIARDLTEQQAQEAALRQAKEEAERADLAKSKFLAAASHDLRQPVQALVFFTSVLSSKLKDSSGALVLANLQNSLDGLNVLLDSLLDVSKLDAGVVTPALDNFPLAPLLARIGSEFIPMARQKGVQLRLVQTGEYVRSDQALLGRILSNLIANAVRYTEEGKIVVGVRRVGDKLQIEVWDSGMGIPEDRIEDIFHEFTQVGNPERDHKQGIGLGLAIVRRLSQLLDHPVRVRSIHGHGSTFSVQVPRARRCDRRSRELVAVDGGRRLVVIIDDEATVLKGLGFILEEWGFEVIAAGSEDEAIHLLERRRVRPHAILADYRLRDGHTGTEAVHHIRALFNAPIPSIIITGDTAPERLREAEASGFSILHKPVQPPHLHSMLAKSMAS